MDEETPKRRPGRPKLPPGRKKGATIPVRWTDAEREAIEKASQAEGVDMSFWIRQTVREKLDSLGTSASPKLS